MADLAEAPNDLVINPELRFAYCPLSGRLWRTDAAGRQLRELTLWRFDEARGQFKIGTIQVGEKCKMMTHVIFFIMMQRWPLPEMVIDHRDRDRSNNAFANLRECTFSQNNMNIDRSGQRWHGADVLESGVHKTPHGTYAVCVCWVNGGTYKSRIEANEVCRRMRRELKGEFDIPFVTWRRSEYR